MLIKELKAAWPDKDVTLKYEDLEEQCHTWWVSAMYAGICPDSPEWRLPSIL
jgi:hypothetical protein